MTPADGGAAFPHDEKESSGAHWHTHSGMSLRDWFAGQALASVLSVNRDYLAKVSKDAAYPIMAVTARDAYALADAMLAERAK